MRELFLLFLILSTGIFISCNNQQSPQKMAQDEELKADTISTQPVKINYDSFGFPFDSARVSDYKVKRNESLYEILARYEVSPQQIYSITRKANDVVNLRSFRPGQNYRIYASADSNSQISRMVWQPSPVDYVVFDWQDSLKVYKEKKEITTKRVGASALITSSLYEAMMEQKLSPLLANKLSEIYAWEIDFFGLRDGDSFKVFYEQKFVDGDFFGTGEILAAEFTHRGETHKAFKFENEEIDGYFDEEGNSVQKALLKAPFNYSQRISSGFSHNRFHPVLKRRMPHYGVDYAAPHGTPVLSVGDGTVTEAQYRGANGNIVKIRHNSTYRTAYLHLSGFANGIRRGATVEQGQVIGYVGRTGRVTGTHLDYRIYKNNRPVNPLTVDLPASRSVPGESMDQFIQVKSYLAQMLYQINDPVKPESVEPVSGGLAR
ncbi:peptidoglycan DD-metalloendopeptidase family protein [Aliifodinibius sp. S!AR15-10]|uniref:peptidoglycan DD-metalloendopeptidase family protein n=1 Tax=Aliifodinibius sp. S!AR15-10 TaxID=2950437 RepID=UPI002858D7C9|nr:peptidoglycan DD-metalloendopeptidase family protein [Aliifodinibius sp. S!AR15-10]MDR8393190.1 peptidoglycan DD-metalloendopeptidase family protein [Aliifodinibius sp. S!AR15-10]